MLLARFLTLLARVDTPEEMLALTFTRKAAGELRARVMALLWERQAPGPDASPWSCGSGNWRPRSSGVTAMKPNSS